MNLLRVRTAVDIAVGIYGLKECIGFCIMGCPAEQPATAQVARLSKQLPSKEGDLKAMAAFLSSQMHADDHVAVDAPEDEDGDLDLT